MRPEQIKPMHLWLGMTALFLVKALDTLPRAVALKTLTAAPWMILIAALLAFLLFWPVAASLSRRPGTGLIDLAIEVGGRPLAILTALALTAFIIGAVAMGLRQVSEMAITAVYPHTPQTWLMSSLLIAATLGAAMRPAGLIWIGLVYIGPSLLAILGALAGNIAWGQFRNIVPLNGPGFLPLAGEALPLTSYFSELFYLAILTKYLNTPRGLVKGSLGILAVTSVIWGLVLLVFLMVFALPGSLAIPFPLYEMTRLVQGGRFFERLDVIWILLWTFGSAGRVAAGLMAGSLLFQGAFQLPDHRGAVLPLAAAVLATAIFPSNLVAAIEVETFLIRQWGFIVALGLPLAIALLAWARRGSAGA